MKSACRRRAQSSVATRCADRIGPTRRIAIYGSRPDGHAKVLLDLLHGSEDLPVVGLIDDFAANRARQVRAPRCSALARSRALRARPRGRPARLRRGHRPARVITASARRPQPAAFVHPARSLGAARPRRRRAGPRRRLLGPDAHLAAGALVNTRAIVEHDVVSSGRVVSPARSSPAAASRPRRRAAPLLPTASSHAPSSAPRVVTRTSLRTIVTGSRQTWRSTT